MKTSPKSYRGVSRLILIREVSSRRHQARKFQNAAVAEFHRESASENSWDYFAAHDEQALGLLDN